MNQVTHKTCGWCAGCGLFNDYDSDLSYGIPICGGCGALGIQITSPEFQERTKRIMDARFRYCPNPLDSGHLPALPAGLQLKALVDLEREVTELWNLHGELASPTCPAAAVSRGALRTRMAALEGDIAKVVKLLQGAKLEGGGRTETTRDALIAAFKGEVDTSEQLWLQAMQENPDSSYIVHDYASFLVNFKRSYELAAPHFERACTMEPKKVIHFFQATLCFASLENEEKKVRRFAAQTRACSDFFSLSEEDQRSILQIIGDA